VSKVRLRGRSETERDPRYCDRGKALLVDLATGVGWERKLFDLLTFAILENS
jgi:hypothetical protein